MPRYVPGLTARRSPVPRQLHGSPLLPLATAAVAAALLALTSVAQAAEVPGVFRFQLPDGREACTDLPTYLSSQPCGGDSAVHLHETNTAGAALEWEVVEAAQGAGTDGTAVSIRDARRKGGKCTADTLTAPADCTGAMLVSPFNASNPYQTWVLLGSSATGYGVRSVECEELYLGALPTCNATQAQLVHPTALDALYIWRLERRRGLAPSGKPAGSGGGSRKLISSPAPPHGALSPQQDLQQLQQVQRPPTGCAGKVCGIPTESSGLLLKAYHPYRGSYFPEDYSKLPLVIDKIVPKVSCIDDYGGCFQDYADRSYNNYAAAEFSGEVYAPQRGTYYFHIDFLGSSGGCRLKVNGTVVVQQMGPGTDDEPVHLNAGWHPITVDYWHGPIGGVVLSWKGPGLHKEIVPAARLRPPRYMYSL